METDKQHLHDGAAKAAKGITGLLMRCGLSETAARWVANLTVGAVIIAALTAGVLTVTSCEEMTPEQMQQAVKIHKKIHEKTGKPCIFNSGK